MAARYRNTDTFPRLGGGNRTMIKNTVFSPCRKYRCTLYRDLLKNLIPIVYLKM